MLVRTSSEEIVTKIIYRIEIPDLPTAAFIIMIGLFIMSIMKNEDEAGKRKNEVKQKEREQADELERGR